MSTNKIKKAISKALRAKRAEGFLDVLIKILITVIIGAALLGLLRIAMPELFNSLINTIKDTFVL